MEENKKWIEYPAEDCPKCGSSNSHVLTSSKEENLIYDDEEARCFDCQHTGYVVTDGECADIVWDPLPKRQGN